MGYGSKSIRDWQYEAHKISRDNGFYENPPSFADRMVLIHSEVSEAVEWYRDHPEDYTPQFKDCGLTCAPGTTHKPEGIPSEMADIVIRVMDFCEYTGIDLERAIREKMEYNKTRAHRHGGKAM